MKTVLDFAQAKARHQKISMITCYDFASAQLVDATDVDCLLVGDSLGMVVYGFDNTVPVTTDMMLPHIRAVVRGAPNKFVIGDLPFLSYRFDLTENLKSVQAFMQTGCHAVKLEGIRGNEDFIARTVQSGIPVCAHLGLTPQFVHQMGGFKVQGRTEQAAEQILADAIKSQELGCFMLVLEGVPNPLAEKITRQLNIPTIGIGAGPDTDGQVLVWHDLLGFNSQFKPKFVRRYFDAEVGIKAALNQFHQSVQEKSFPSLEESYS